MKLELILFGAFFLLMSCLSREAIDTAHSDGFYLEIKQTVYGGFQNQYTFVLTQNRIHIIERSISEEGKRKKEIYSKNIKNRVVMNDIKEKAKKLTGLNPEYINAQLGGLRWEISYYEGDEHKKIIVENEEVNEITILFETINSIIPNNKPPLLTWH